MTDNPSTIETELRAVLVRQRPAEGASRELRTRVADIPDRVRIENPLLALLRRAAVPLAAAGVASAAVILASIALTRSPVIGLPPIVGGLPPVVPFDPAVEGVGLLTSVVPTLLIVQWVLVGIALALAARLAFGAERHTGRSKLFAMALVIGAAVVAPTTRFAMVDGLGLGPGAVRAVLAGYDLEEPPDRPLNEYDRYYQTAAAGEATTVMFSIANAGPVPLRLEGVTVDPDSLDLAQAHWSAVWIQSTTSANREITPVDQPRPFEPTTIAPGQEVHVYLVGRAGPCAYGPGYTPDSEVAGWTMLGPTVEVAYSFVGLVGTTTIDMDQAFVEPHRNNCDPA